MRSKGRNLNAINLNVILCSTDCITRYITQPLRVKQLVAISLNKSENSFYSDYFDVVFLEIRNSIRKTSFPIVLGTFLKQKIWKKLSISVHLKRPFQTFLFP